MKYAALALALCACGSQPGPPDAGAVFPADALLSLDTDASKLKLELRSSPQPPARGVNAFRYNLRTPAGGPAEGLSFTVQPWMPAMGHGASVSPTIIERGGGVYDLTNVALAMPGTWQLRTTFVGSVEDFTAPTVEIP